MRRMLQWPYMNMMRRIHINPLNAELNPFCHLLILLRDLTFMSTCTVSIFQYISNKMQRYTVYLYLETALLFRVVLSPIIRSAYNCIYSVWFLSHRYCYLPLLVVCAPDDGWRYYPKHVEQFPDINKQCNVASCWIYVY
jgi:hypothetical protein